MSPLDRIAQLTQENRSMETAALRLADDFDKLTEENRQLSRSIDLLRSQLADARKQLEADSQTIAKLAKDKREFFAESAELLNAITLWIEADMRQAPPNAESMAAFFLPTFCKNAHNFLSSHA